MLMVYNKTGDNAYQTTWNSGTTIQNYCSRIGFSITGDSDKDGKNELLVIGEDTYIFIWEYNGSYSLVHAPLITNNPDPNWGYDTYPIISDVDNDNLNEIVISSGGSDGWQLSVFNPDIWSLSFHNSIGLYGDFTFPAAADLNGNGIPELFFGEEESPYRLIVYELIVVLFLKHLNILLKMEMISGI